MFRYENHFLVGRLLWHLLGNPSDDGSQVLLSLLDVGRVGRSLGHMFSVGLRPSHSHVELLYSCDDLNLLQECIRKLIMVLLSRVVLDVISTRLQAEQALALSKVNISSSSNS